MADKYAVAAGGNWSAAGTWALTDGGAGGAGAPSAAENAFFSNQSGNVVVDAAVTCLDLDCTKGTGYTGTVSGSAQLTISGSAKFKGTWTHTGTKLYNATSTGKTITHNGVSLTGTITWDGVGGGWTFQDAFTHTGSFTLQVGNGTLNTNGFTWTALRGPNGAASGAWTINGGVSNFNVGGGSGCWTVNANGSTRIASFGSATITMAVTSGTNVFDNGTYGTVTFTAMNGWTLQATGATFTALSLLGSAVKTDSLLLSTNLSITTLKYLGNSSVNRLLIRSDVTGTTRTITAAAIDAASNDCDFRDITGAGAAAPFATGSRLGDCLGNSGITFTAPVSPNKPSGTASFSWSTATWTSAGRPPLPQDDVVIDNAFVAGRTITCDMPRMGKSITCTCTGNPALAMQAGDEWYGSITLASGMTITAGVGVTMRARSSVSITSNGVAWIPVLNWDGPAGTFTFQDAFICASSGSVHSLLSGTLTAASGVSFLTSCRLTTNAGSTWDMGSSTWEWQGIPSGNTVFAISGNVTPGTSTIKLSFSDAAAKTLSLGGKTFNNIWIAGSSTWSANFIGSNTFNEFKMDAGRSALFTAGTTTTVAKWNATGTLGNLVAIGSITAASHTLAFSTNPGHVEADYLSISRSTVTPANWWFAGTHSTDGGNNSGWVFADYVGMVGAANVVASVTPQLATQIRLQASPQALTEWLGSLGTAIVCRGDLQVRVTMSAPLATSILMLATVGSQAAALAALSKNEGAVFKVPPQTRTFRV